MSPCVSSNSYLTQNVCKDLHVQKETKLCLLFEPPRTNVNGFWRVDSSLIPTTPFIALQDLMVVCFVGGRTAIALAFPHSSCHRDVRVNPSLKADWGEVVIDVIIIELCGGLVELQFRTCSKKVSCVGIFFTNYTVLVFPCVTFFL